MDLSEVRANDGKRHPWELARERAIEEILLRHGPSPISAIVDYGCGDGFTGLSIFERFRASRYCGVDLHLTEADCQRWSSEARGIRFTNDASAIEPANDLALLCDVIEHVQDDVDLVVRAARQLTADGRMVITVPAFQSLFSSHDSALRHFRRYSLRELEVTVRRAGLRLIASGYLFGSLLLPRALGVIRERLFPVRELPPEFGIGGWSGGPALTRLLSRVLEADNTALLALGRLGIKVPGLTAWAVAAPGTE